MRAGAGAVFAAGDIRLAGNGGGYAADGDLTNVGVVGVTKKEILSHHRHSVRAVEARRIAGAVVAALLKKLARDDSQRLRGGVDRLDRVVAAVRDVNRAAVSRQPGWKIQPRSRLRLQALQVLSDCGRTHGENRERRSRGQECFQVCRDSHLRDLAEVGWVNRVDSLILPQLMERSLLPLRRSLACCRPRRSATR